MPSPRAQARDIPLSRILIPWIVPGLIAAIILLGFALPDSGNPDVALTLFALIGCLAAALWAIPTKETPRLKDRPYLLPVLLSCAFLALVVLYMPIKSGLFPHSMRLGLLYDPSNGYVEILKLAGLACALLVGFRSAQSDPAGKRVMTAILVVVGAWALASIIMYLLDPDGVYGIMKVAKGRLTGAFGSANSAATLFGSTAIIAMGLAISSYFSRQSPRLVDRLNTTAVVVTILCFGALGLTVSRSGIFATILCAAVVIFALTWKKVPPGRLLIVGIGCVVLVAVALGGSMASLIHRMGEVSQDAQIRAMAFKTHFDIARHQAFFGSGLGSFNTVNSAILNETTYHELSLIKAAHNVYLQWFEEAGLVGLLAIGAVNVTLLWPMIVASQRRQSVGPRIVMILGAYLVFLVHGLTDYAFQEPALEIFVAVLLGVGFALATNSRRAD